MGSVRREKLLKRTIKCIHMISNHVHTLHNVNFAELRVPLSTGGSLPLCIVFAVASFR